MVRLSSEELRRNAEIEKARREVEAQQRSIVPAGKENRGSCLSGLAAIVIGVLAIGIILAASVIGEERSEVAYRSEPLTALTPAHPAPSPPHFTPRLLPALEFSPTYYRYRRRPMRDFQLGINEEGRRLIDAYSVVCAEFERAAKSNQLANSPHWRNEVVIALHAMRAAGNRLAHYPERATVVNEQSTTFEPIGAYTNEIADAIERSLNTDSDDYWAIVPGKVGALTEALRKAQSGLRDVRLHRARRR